MSRIRKIEINHFRCIHQLNWTPSGGINCLIGPGDAGKSTVLEALELCLSVRRNVQFFDTDFYRMDVEAPIVISVTLGELDESLKNLDNYGLYLRGFKADKGTVLDEPEASAETALTIQLTVRSDLEGSWSLYSERAAAQNQSRSLSWSDRAKIAPTRIGAIADYNLSWRRGSVLNRISDERADASSALAKAGRDARKAFGDSAKDEVAQTLAVVTRTAKELGIPTGDVTAMLDAHSISLSGGTISLHDEDGIPLRGLGLGSSRLLIAGLQRSAAGQASVVLVDEIEYGLEPHRIMRLMTSLGSKENSAPLQVFMTTHSPVALRELAASQLFKLHHTELKHEARNVGNEDVMQATIRACPEAFLAVAVVVAEGASEIGLVRGLDLYRIGAGNPSISALGVALADGHGETTFRRANSLSALGYKTLILRDADKPPAQIEAEIYAAGGGTVLMWRDGRALEEELFLSLSDGAVKKLLEAAVENIDEVHIDDNIKSASQNAFNLAKCRAALTPDKRIVLGKAAKKKSGWFKSISAMELVGREIVGPDLDSCEAGFRDIIQQLFYWIDDVGK